MENPTFMKIIPTEAENLAVKIFSETCCESCSCKSETDHKKVTE